MAMRDLNIGTKVGLELLNDRWYALTISNLTEHPLDFMQLRQLVRGLSTIKLMTVLAKLQRLELVRETGHYQYQLTPVGLEIQTSLIQLEAWGDRMISEMQSF